MCGEENYRGTLASLWVETVFWGINIFIYCSSIYALRKQRASSVFYYFSTLIFAIYTCDGSYCSPCGAETAASVREADLDNLINVIRGPSFLVNQLAADAMMIWRCFMIWNRDYRVVALPTICLMMFFAACVWDQCVAAQLYFIRDHAPVSETVPPADWLKDVELETDLDTVTNALPFFINTITMLLIVGRILYGAYRINGTLRSGFGGNSVYKYIAYIIIESQALLLCAYILQFIGTYTNATFGNLTESFLIQVTGTAPTLLVLQLAYTPRPEVNIYYTVDMSTEDVMQFAPRERVSNEYTQRIPDST